MDSTEAADNFFQTSPHNPTADEVMRNAGLFLLHHGYTGVPIEKGAPPPGHRPIALVTSGGTTAGAYTRPLFSST